MAAATNAQRIWLVVRIALLACLLAAALAVLAVQQARRIARQQREEIAQWTVKGSVTEFGTLWQPIAGATVTLGTKSAVTDAKGHFWLDARGFPPGEYEFRVTAPGYADATGGRIDLPREGVVSSGPVEHTISGSYGIIMTPLEPRSREASPVPLP